MNLLRKAKPVLTDEDAVEADTFDALARDQITLMLQLSVPRAARISEQRDEVYSLAGQLLVATPLIRRGVFAKSVVYLMEHTAAGAMGLVVNKPIETVSYDALIIGQNMNHLPRDNTLRHMSVLEGGPCEPHRGFVLHSADYLRSFNFHHGGELAVTAANTIVNDMVLGTGPRRAALVVGYAGWGPGQLEQEMAENAWVSVPATEDLVLGTPDALKWSMASQSLGIRDMAFYSTAVGHA